MKPEPMTATLTEDIVLVESDVAAAEGARGRSHATYSAWGRMSGLIGEFGRARSRPARSADGLLCAAPRRTLPSHASRYPLPSEAPWIALHDFSRSCCSADAPRHRVAPWFLSSARWQ